MLLILLLSRHLVASALAMQLKPPYVFKMCLPRAQLRLFAQLVQYVAFYHDRQKKLLASVLRR